MPLPEHITQHGPRPSSKRWRPCTRVWKMGIFCTGIDLKRAWRVLRFRKTGFLNEVGNPRYDTEPYQSISPGDDIRNRAHMRLCEPA